MKPRTPSRLYRRENAETRAAWTNDQLFSLDQDRLASEETHLIRSGSKWGPHVLWRGLLEILKDTLFEKFNSLQSEIQLLNQQRQVAVEQRDFLKTANEELEEDMRLLRSTYDNERLSNSEIKKQIIAMTEERRGLEMRQAELLEEMERLYAERSVLMKLCDTQKSRYEKFKRRMRVLWRGVDILKNDSLQNRRRSVRQEQMLNELKIENEALRVSISSHQAALEELKRTNLQLTSEDREQIQLSKSLRDEYERTSDDLIRARRQVTELEVRLARSEANAREEITKLNARIQEQDDFFSARVAEATEATMLERQTLKAQAQELNQKVRELEETTETLRLQMSKIEREAGSKLETIQLEHDRLVENMRFEYESQIRKLKAEHDAITHSLINDRKKAIDEAVADSVTMIQSLQQRVEELQRFAEQQIEVNQKIINEKNLYQQGAEIANQLEREVIVVRDENVQLSQSLTSLQALWDNSITQREDAAEREARYKAANEELMTALTIAQKSAEELRERLKAERRENSQVIGELQAELEDLRRDQQVSRGLRQAQQLTQEPETGPSNQLEAAPTTLSGNPSVMGVQGTPRDRKQWDEFYSRWGKRISQLTTGTVPAQNDIPKDLSGRHIPDPPTALQRNPANRVDMLRDQLISERGDLQSLD